MENEKRILMIGPFPGPIKGLSLSNFIVKKGLEAKGWNLKIIDTENENDIDVKFGKFSFSKLVFLKTYLELYKIFSVKKVYITIGITFFGVLKYAPFIILSKILKKETTVHVHSNHLKTEFKNLSKLKKFIFFKILSLFNKGIVISKSLRDNLTPFLKEEKIFQVHYGFESDLIKDLNFLIDNKDYSEMKLFFLSNLLEEKGINDLLLAIIQLNKEGFFPNVKIAGTKVSSNNLEELFLQVKNVEYVGVVQNQAKTDLLTWGNVFCLPTYYTMEGLPISITESMAFGNLILTTDHAGIKDLCKDEYAIYCDKKNPKDLADKIKYIYKNFNVLKENAIKNGVYARVNLTEEKYILNVEKVILSN